MYNVNNSYPELEDDFFHFVPAAIEYTNFGGLGCYVRYKPFTNKPIKIIEGTTSKLYISCPDRDILLIRDSHRANCYKPPEGVWDCYIPFSVTNPNSQVDNSLNYYMLNYTDYIKGDASPNLRKNRKRLPYESKIISDSGGFQLMMGRYEWLSPEQLVHWYNDNVDIGMILDIPTHGLTEDSQFELIAKAQKHNTNILLDNARDDLEFFNIFHGIGEQQIKFRECVDDPRIRRAAIGGAYLGTFMYTFHGNFKLIRNLGVDGYKHVHILGVWNLLQLIPTMRFASHRPVNLITSDASTAVQNANSKNYAFHPTIDSKWELRSIGINSQAYVPNHHVHLPCNCPVCTAVKYLDVLAVIPGALVTHSLVHHNIWAMNRYVAAMREVVAKESIDTILELMYAQLGTRKGLEEAKWGLSLADDMATCSLDDLDKVTAKYSLHLGMNRDIDYSYEDSTPVLFGEEEESEENENVEPEVQRKLDLATKFLQNYQGNHGKEFKKATAKKVHHTTHKVKTKVNRLKGTT